MEKTITRKNEIESMKIIHFSDVKYYWQLLFDELEEVFNIYDHDYNTDYAIAFLTDHDYKINSNFSQI